jgi:DNA-binding response OmpR family regulator
VPRRLDLSDKAVELMAYLSLHRGPGGSNEQTARALWPHEPLSRAMQLLDETVAEVNDVVASETGKPVPAIPSGDQGPTPAWPASPDSRSDLRRALR